MNGRRNRKRRDNLDKIIYNDKFKKILINLRLFEQIECEIEKQVVQEMNVFIMGALIDTSMIVISGCKAIINENGKLCILLEKDSDMKKQNYRKDGWLAYVENTVGKEWAENMDKYIGKDMALRKSRRS